MEEEKKEIKEDVKVEKETQDKEIEFGFPSGMESIGEPLDADNILDNIYAAVDN